MIERLKEQYLYFYNKVFKKEYLFSYVDEKPLQTFTKLIDKEYGDGIGDEWLFEYLLFQFGKFDFLKTKIPTRLNWVYGKKALNVYKNRERGADHFKKEFRKEFNIRRKDRIPNVNLSKSYKDYERNRFEDKMRQFIHCQELELFDEKSADCRFCKYKKNCSG